MNTRRVRPRLGALLAASALLLGVACGGGGNNAASDKNETSTDGPPVAGGALSYLFLGAAPGATGFDPVAVTATSYTGGAPYFSAVFGMLVYEDFKAGKVQPWMAESLTATDMANWVLKLREGVNFSDGTPLDAEAVKVNWERIQQATTSPIRSIAMKVKSMSVVDARTLHITLVAPNAAFDHTVARSGLTFIGSPTAIRSAGGGFGKAPVGAGPFVLKSLGPDGTAELEKSPTYWDKPRPHLDRLTIRLIADDQQRYNTFTSTGAHLMDLSPVNVVRDQVEAAGLTILDIDTPGGGNSLIFNTKQEPFNDKDARLALQHAVDVEGLNRLRFGGRATPTPTFFAKGTPFYEPKAMFPTFDEAKAQRMFDDYAAKHGPMKITMATTAGPGNLAETLQAQLSGFKNVSIEINAVNPASLVPTLLGGSFDVVAFPISMSHPLSEFQTFYESTGSFNFGKYSNPRVDTLLAEAASSSDRNKQVALFSEIQQLLIEDAVVLYMNRSPHTAVHGDALKNVSYAGNGIWLWDRMWLDPSAR